MLTTEEFESIRNEICASGPASDGDDPLGMEIDACGYLEDPAAVDDEPGLWSGMEVRRTDTGSIRAHGHIRAGLGSSASGDADRPRRALGRVVA